jgi:transposase-like protein
MRNIQALAVEAEWTEDDAHRVLEDWRQSGQTIAAFARQRGLSAPRLYWWRRRLPKEPPVAPPIMSLVPARVMARPVSAAVVVRLPSGVTIEIADASPAWVAAIVAELERAS